MFFSFTFYYKGVILWRDGENAVKINRIKNLKEMNRQMNNYIFQKLQRNE